MKQALLWRDSETFILSSIELYNWGGFQGYHRAEIDPSGTAVIGPTGSGKTTLVDALMTLLCANPRYNLASRADMRATAIWCPMCAASPAPGTDA